MKTNDSKKTDKDPPTNSEAANGSFSSPIYRGYPFSGSPLDLLAEVATDLARTLDQDTINPPDSLVLDDNHEGLPENFLNVHRNLHSQFDGITRKKMTDFGKKNFGLEFGQTIDDSKLGFGNEGVSRIREQKRNKKSGNFVEPEKIEEDPRSLIKKKMKKRVDMKLLNDHEFGHSNPETIDAQLAFIKKNQVTENSVQLTENREEDSRPLKKQKQKKKKENKQLDSNPLPDMPKEMRDMIRDMGGSNVEFIIEKKLYASDLSKNNGRFSVPLIQAKAEFLTKYEEEDLGQKNKPMEVLLIQPCLKISPMSLKKWKSKGESSSYVLTTNWNSVVAETENGLRQGLYVRLWSFRVDYDLCFALSKVGDGGKSEAGCRNSGNAEMEEPLNFSDNQFI